MDSGTDITLTVLRKTANLAAIPWLIAALEHPAEQWRHAALESLLHKSAEVAHQAIVRRWSRWDESERALIQQHGSRLGQVLRDGILSSDQELNRCACEVATSLRDYDQIPTLIRAAEDQANPCAEQAGLAVVSLADSLHAELATARDYRNRRDPALVRQYVYGAFEDSLRRYGRHRRDLLVEGFLQLALKGDSHLKQVLNDASDPAYTAVVAQLTHSPRPGVMRLLLELLDDFPAPATVLHILARRKDQPFVRYMLGRPFEKCTHQFLHNLNRLDSWAWLRDDTQWFGALSDAELSNATRLVCESGTSRLRAFEVVRFALNEGGPQSRRAAAACLGDFRGVEANDLVMVALKQKDPEIQVAAIRQLRERSIPNSLHRLVELLRSPEESVRKAAQEQLTEFTFPRFVASYEMLDKQTRLATGPLVKQVDPEAIERLRAELISVSRSRRLRGLELSVCLQAAKEVEEQILLLSCDEDHFVRAASAEALVNCGTERASSRLAEMQLDRAVSVQEAAETALARFRSVPDPFASLT